MRDRMRRELGDRLPTPRDFIKITRRGTFHDHPRFIGSPKDVADGLEEWLSTRACDGFVVAASHVPGAYEDFSRLVVPELQRRGLFHTEYQGLRCARILASTVRRSGPGDNNRETTMKLYYAPGACSIGIHVLLEEIGKPYESERVNLQKGEQYKPPFTEVNPKSKVPHWCAMTARC